MIYKEYDIPRSDKIKEYQKMSAEERKALLQKMLKEDREEKNQ